MSELKHQLHGFSGEWNVEKIIGKVKGKSDSFYLCNLSDVVRKFDDWITKMPRVKPFYAVRISVTDNLSSFSLEISTQRLSAMMTTKSSKLSHQSVVHLTVRLRVKFRKFCH
jgi:hypothetical protein